MKRVIIITGSDLRHEFLRKFIANSPKCQVIRSYCESSEQNLNALVSNQDQNALRKKHLDLRTQSERHFFESYVRESPDNSNAYPIVKGEINQQNYIDEIIRLNPDLIISYGCSIIKPALIEAFSNKFLNIHLGLSPYYRGSGTNYWPLVNGEPECVGVTFMHIDSGIDTGKIIHQMRARIYEGDDVHSIGNRMIGDIAATVPEIVSVFERVESQSQKMAGTDRIYRNRDFSEESLERLYRQFESGMISEYLGHKQRREDKYPIIQNRLIRSIEL